MEREKPTGLKLHDCFNANPLNDEQRRRMREIEELLNHEMGYRGLKGFTGAVDQFVRFYWGAVLTTLIGTLGIMVVAWFASLFELGVGWWLLLPVGIISLISAQSGRRTWGEVYYKHYDLRVQLERLRWQDRDSKLVEVRNYIAQLEADTEAVNRCFHDVREAVRTALQSPEGTTPLRPNDMSIALAAVRALLDETDLPDVVQTITVDEHRAYLAQRREIDPSEYTRLQNANRWYDENWPKLAEVLRGLVQRVWQAKSETSSPLAAEVRKELVRAIHKFFGERSYQWNFVKDLGAAHELVSELEAKNRQA